MRLLHPSLQTPAGPSSTSSPACPGLPRKNRSLASIGFSLLEVMIACGVFFLCIFAILELVSTLLRNANRLRRVEVDAGLVAAQLYKTNRLTEGVESGDFGSDFKGYSWTTESKEAATNGLWEVDIVVNKQGEREPIDKMAVFVYSPQSSQQLGPTPRTTPMPGQRP